MGPKQLASKMVGYAAKIPGTRASKARMRKVVLAMVKQIALSGGDYYTLHLRCACNYSFLLCIYQFIRIPTLMKYLKTN